jgi:hypothetical protein
MNSKIVKSGMMLLTEREKADVAVAESCSLPLEPWWTRGREKDDMT